jgi:hypothetical protein
MIKKSIYKVIIFPIIFLFFSDLLPLLALCDENISEIVNENTNEENSKNAFQALMLFISASIFLYFLRNGFPISFSGSESLDIASKVTETATTAPSQELVNSLQNQLYDADNVNAHLKNTLRIRDAELKCATSYIKELEVENFEISNKLDRMQNEIQHIAGNAGKYDRPLHNFIRQNPDLFKK